MGGYFSLGREKPLPSNYGDQLTPVTYDVVLAGWITAFLLLYVSFLAILPGYSLKKGWRLAMRITFDLSVGLSIVLGLFGQEWEIAKIHKVHTPYKPGSGKEIKADIGLHIGLKGINITLKEVDIHHEGPMHEAGSLSQRNGTQQQLIAGLINNTMDAHPDDKLDLFDADEGSASLLWIGNATGVQSSHDSGDANSMASSHHHVWQKETINYNERFWWTWRQGRFGFGTEAGLMQKEFRAAQFRGVPIPILRVAEYFTIDGEGFRFGRRYRTAGWYAHFLLWCAFASWLLGNILLRMVVRKGAKYVTLTGVFMVLANIVWVSIRNQPVELSIPFGSEKEEILRTRFGIHFWGVLVAGVESIIAGISIYIMDQINPNFAPEFFNVDPLLEYEEAVLSHDELQSEEQKNRTSFGRGSSSHRRRQPTNILGGQASPKVGHGIEMGPMHRAHQNQVEHDATHQYDVVQRPKASATLGAKFVSKLLGDKK